jgi:hypothetical protein
MYCINVGTQGVLQKKALKRNLLETVQNKMHPKSKKYNKTRRTIRLITPLTTHLKRDERLLSSRAARLNRAQIKFGRGCRGDQRFGLKPERETSKT